MTEYITRNNPNEDDEEDYEYDEDGEIVYYAVRPNKTKIKKEIASLLALGEEISSLPSAQITALGLPEKLEMLIREIAKMPRKSARKRQLKFIGQQFYKMESLVEPIIEKVAKFKNQSGHAVREHHIVERWRTRLLSEGNAALTELLDEQPHADRQHLRHTMRNAQKELATGKPSKSSRLLYRYLKTLFDFDESIDEEQATAMATEFDDEADDFDDEDEDDD
ncbi:MAG: ribosome biogenesis factor YjgA [Methylococcales bacterium]|nr:ribosome biogenesis factor YjgA [Methylococcales bacterium]MDD5754434.1 ribosome biogenesis factor YjgA [Methylococcales bacterium]